MSENLSCQYHPSCPLCQPMLPPPMGDDSPRCHVHEVLGSVMLSPEWEDPRLCPAGDTAGLPQLPQGQEASLRPRALHTHRFATVSGPAIPVPGGHVHEVSLRTDFHEDHFHLILGPSGLPVAVGDRHVHFLTGRTSLSDGHCHPFRAASLLEDPTGR